MHDAASLMTEEEPKPPGSRTSVAFLLAIPTAFCISLVSIKTTLAILRDNEEDLLPFGLFLLFFFFACVSMRFVDAERFRTVIHELKHALVLLVTRNRVTDLQIAESRGHVRYALQPGKVHFEPFVLVAPYFFPLFSSVLFLFALLIGSSYRAEVAAVLGVAVGMDLQMGYGEIHPDQSDLKRVWGGRPMSHLFLFCAHACWFSLALLWAAAGRDGLLRGGYSAIESVYELIEGRETSPK